MAGNKEREIKRERHYLRMWKLLYFIGHRFLVIRFKFKHDRIYPGKSCLVVSNHVTNWDPMLLAMSFPRNNLHFVASEHLFRLPAAKLINYLASLIARRKGSSGLDTAMSCLRKIRAGGSVCIFAEGECTWDGRSIDIFASTGTLAKICGAPLVTYRLEGGYFSLPRWSNGLRRGKMRGHMVNIYQPEQLRNMKPEEINELINRDIYEDAWERQRTEMIPYRSKKRAECIDGALFLCPSCRRVGTIKGQGCRVTCECGLDIGINEYGFFEPAQPFETIRDWDKWQHEALAKGDFVYGEEVFADEGVILAEVKDDHSMDQLAEGRLSLRGREMIIGNYIFPLHEILDLAVVRTNRLIFTFRDKYYELRQGDPAHLRKYFSAWRLARTGAAEQ